MALSPRRDRPLRPPPRAARRRRPRTGEAQGRARPRDRRRRARRAADPVPRRGRHRHDRDRRRRRGLPLEPAAAGDPRHAGCRAASRWRARPTRSARLNPHVAVEAHATRIDARERPRARARLRPRRRRLGQFRDPLRGVGRLLPRGQAARDGGARPVRRLAHHDPGARDAAPDGRPNPTYRCLFPSPPPPGADPDLRGGRRARRARGRHGQPDGDGGDPRDRRLRRGPRRAPPDGRCARACAST